MDRALVLAREAADAGEIPVGCLVIGPEGRILGEGRNRRESDADATAHAEIQAIRQACRRRGSWRLDDCVLVVTLEPCPMCAGAAAQARVERVVFGAYDAQAGCCGSIYRIPEDPAFPWYAPCDGGCQREECEALWDGAFADQRSEQT